ncbi:MAG: 30S ribosomal protein S24e [Candidatus Wukongarchaeota archaeon]|jgi:small subunit ribosomal protein S24e|nr:30S ribosomal protein S24e [Candidatus Wukongarchaeota archaeon]MDO8129710.1 30S ribosomal protein S24e [Candidatus Wukongarchaeota archaeon]
MEIEVIKDKKNPLLYRQEISFIIHHAEEATPSRYDVRKKIAAKFNTDIERTYIRSILSEYGSATSKGEASIYDTPELGEKIEEEHIRKRNQPKETKEAS